MSYVQTLESVINRIEKARLATDRHRIVKIVAASKYSETEEIEKLFAVGQRAFGESKVQDLQQKQEALESLPIEWHFIGRLQKNKINHLIRTQPSLMHSLDSLELAEEMEKRLAAQNQNLNCLLQINSAYEESKTGVAPEEAESVYGKIVESCPHIHLKGVMTIGAHSEEERDVTKSFETTHEIFQKLQSQGAAICSMGMSGDFELAIRCGSNMLRLGSILFKDDDAA